MKAHEPLILDPAIQRSSDRVEALAQCRSVKRLNGDFWLVSGLWPVGVVEAFGGPLGDLAFDDARV